MSTDKPLQGRRILVAEDDPLLAFDLIGLLLKAGAQIAGPALSLERALELARTEQLNCGILDVKLRDGLVFPAARILRDKGAGIVFYTGHHDPEGLKQDWPQAHVLLKPAPLHVLMRAVVEACAGTPPAPSPRAS
jgi:DNA-binding response OmpR family regulator